MKMRIKFMGDVHALIMALMCGSRFKIMLENGQPFEVCSKASSQGGAALNIQPDKSVNQTLARILSIPVNIPYGEAVMSFNFEVRDASPGEPSKFIRAAADESETTINFD